MEYKWIKPNIFHFPNSPDNSRSSTPKSDSELITENKDNPEMLWTWGELPQAAQVFTHLSTLTDCMRFQPNHMHVILVLHISIVHISLPLKEKV